MERSLLAGINFTTAFQDEDKLVEGIIWHLKSVVRACRWILVHKMKRRAKFALQNLCENPLHPMLCCISEILNFYLFYQEFCSCKWTFFFVDIKYPKVASWDSFFQGSVSRVLLTLVGSPPGSSPNNKPDPNRSVDTVPVSDKQAVKFQETSPVNGKCKVSQNESLLS